MPSAGHNEAVKDPAESRNDHMIPKRQILKGGKGKCPNVQVIEGFTSHADPLYVNGNFSKSASIATTKSNYRGANARNVDEGKMGPNRAATEDSHWVVTGSSKHGVIHWEQIFYGHPPQPVHNNGSRGSYPSEHQQDPPSNGGSKSDDDSAKESNSEEGEDLLLNPSLEMCQTWRFCG